MFLQLFITIPERINDIVVLLFSRGEECPVISIFFLSLLFELGLELEYDLVSFLLALKVTLCVFGQFDCIVLLFALFCFSLVLE